MKPTLPLIAGLAALGALSPPLVEANPITCCRIKAKAAPSGGYALSITLNKQTLCLAEGESCPPTSSVRVSRDGAALTLTLTASEETSACRYSGLDDPGGGYGVYGLEIDAIRGQGTGKKAYTCKSGAEYGLHPDLGVPDLWAALDAPAPRDAVSDSEPSTPAASDGCAVSGRGQVGSGAIVLGLCALLLWARRRRR